MHDVNYAEKTIEELRDDIETLKERVSRETKNSIRRVLILYGVLYTLALFLESVLGIGLIISVAAFSIIHVLCWWFSLNHMHQHIMLAQNHMMIHLLKGTNPT